MINGVVIKQLKKIPDERGCVMPMLKITDPEFEQFGEIYFSVVYPGVVKGWHYHEIMTLNYAVVKGNIKLALYDSREDSPTKGEVQEIFLGDNNYCLVTVPCGVWNGFKGVGVEESIIANCATHPHDPLEIKRMDPFSGQIPYNWNIKHE